MLTGKQFEIEIVTPKQIEFTGKIESVTLPGTYAPFQVLANHAPIVSQLDIGELRFNDSANRVTKYAISGGFVQVFHNKVSVIVESAEESTNIDAKRALEARKRAQERIAKRENVDMMRAELSLARAMNRLRVAGKGDL